MTHEPAMLPGTIAEAAEWLRAGRITASALTETLLVFAARRDHLNHTTAIARVERLLTSIAIRRDADHAGDLDWDDCAIVVDIA